MLSISAWCAGTQCEPSPASVPAAVMGCSLEPCSGGPGCALGTCPQQPCVPRGPRPSLDGDRPLTAARRSLHHPHVLRPVLTLPWATALSPLPDQRQKGGPEQPQGLPRGWGHGHPAPCCCGQMWPHGPLCLCGAAQSHLWCETGGNKEHCLDARPFPSSTSKARWCFSQQQCPLSPTPYPTEHPQGQDSSATLPDSKGQCQELVFPSLLMA